MNTEQMRQDFELKISMEYEQPPSIERDGDGYADGYVDNAWWGWQAALSAKSVPVLYAVPDFDEICKVRNGCTLCSKEPSDLHTVPLYAAPQPPTDDRVRELEKEAARLDWVAIHGSFGVDSVSGKLGGNGQKRVAATRNNIDEAMKGV
jgi:hypothetical protein